MWLVFCLALTAIFDCFNYYFELPFFKEPSWMKWVTYLSSFLEAFSQIFLLWFILKFIDIAADAKAQQRNRFSEASDDFKFYDESIQDRESMMTREFVNVVRSTENVVARSVANAFGSEKKELAPRVKKHGWEYKN